jgi:hypothetical protein
MAISFLLEIVGFNRNAVRRFVPACSMGWDSPVDAQRAGFVQVPARRKPF